MERAVATFVDGIGAAAATSGVLSQLEGRIFALLYLQERPLALEELAAELQQSKSNISVNIRGLVDWHLVRRVRVPGSRKDHYEAATNLWRVMQEIMERRFRWNVRQVMATTAETKRVAAEDAQASKRAADREQAALLAARLDTLLAFFSALDAAISAVHDGRPFSPDTLKNLVPALPERAGRGS
jgi:DNA-binding transcriptional regulator GbsR (MarR family)